MALPEDRLHARAMETFWVVVAYVVLLGIPAVLLYALSRAWRAVRPQ